jgi:hypothetical protein
MIPRVLERSDCAGEVSVRPRHTSQFLESKLCHLVLKQKNMKQFTTSVPALPPANFIANPVLAMKNQPLYIVPEFIRLPKPGTQEPFTGLSRAKLNELVLPTKKNDFKPLVRSISLRKVGEKFGVRLIVLESLLSYLRSKL